MGVNQVLKILYNFQTKIYTFSQGSEDVDPIDSGLEEEKEEIVDPFAEFESNPNIIRKLKRDILDNLNHTRDADGKQQFYVNYLLNHIADEFAEYL